MVGVSDEGNEHLSDEKLGGCMFKMTTQPLRNILSGLDPILLMLVLTSGAEFSFDSRSFSDTRATSCIQDTAAFTLKENVDASRQTDGIQPHLS